MAEFGVPHHIRTKPAIKEMFRNPRRVFRGTLSDIQWNQRQNTRQAEKAIANLHLRYPPPTHPRFRPLLEALLHTLDVANQTAIHWACESIHRDIVIGRYPSKPPYVMDFGDRPVLSMGYQAYWHDFLRNELDPQLNRDPGWNAPTDFLRRLWKFADHVPLVSENQSGLRYGIPANFRMCYVYGSLLPQDDPINRIIIPTRIPTPPPRTPSPPPSPSRRRYLTDSYLTFGHPTTTGSWSVYVSVSTYDASWSTSATSTGSTSSKRTKRTRTWSFRPKPVDMETAITT